MLFAQSSTVKWLVLLSVITFQLTAKSVSAQSPTGEASLTFSPENITARVGETFTTEIAIDTAGAEVGGIGAKITFDPKVLNVEKIETLPVFPDYPATTFDNVTGNMVISGIVNGKDQLYSGRGVFATVSWTAKAPGVSTIQFNFKPNDTKDSNIAVLYGNGDILQKVNTVAVTVEGDAVSLNTTSAEIDSQSDRVMMPLPTEVMPETLKPVPATVESKSFFTPQKVLAVLLLASFVLHFFMFKKVQLLEDKLYMTKPTSLTDSTKNELTS